MSEVLGVYSLSKNATEVLVLQSEHRFEHCWKTATGEDRVQRGKWDYSATRNLSVVFANGFTRVHPRSRLEAEPAELMLPVSEMRGRLILDVDPDDGVYFEKHSSDQGGCGGR